MKKGQRRYKNWLQEGFPLWLQQRMEEKHWSASELARRIEVVPNLISRWMSGYQQPSRESLQAIAEAFDVPLLEVLRAAGHLPPEVVTDDPRLLELRSKLERIELTHERYLTINSLLNLWLNIRPPEDDLPPGVPAASNGSHPRS